jgi:peptidoglycan/xylan/chitin deacetylase (PgdA/CDA1 family)
VLNLALVRLLFKKWIPVFTGMTGLLLLSAMAGAAETQTCRGTVYLTIDTGSMAPAGQIAAILKKHEVKATFFLANEKTLRGDTTLDAEWRDFWKARAAEGHAFGSHTWRHWYFRSDAGSDKVNYVPWGEKKGELLDRAGVCAELAQSETAFKALTGRGFDGIWRAPGGKTTPNTLRFAESCGYRHVGWSPAGFSGDELPSEKFPGDTLIVAQLHDIQSGDILLWHLGIRSRKEPLWPRLDELIAGLKARGLCFARISDAPQWKH